MRFTVLGLVLAGLGLWALLAGSTILGILLLIGAFTFGGLDLFKRRPGAHATRSSDTRARNL